jgi:ubiquinone/menaquinone biosynthesis C-methylase UbiE
MTGLRLSEQDLNATKRRVYDFWTEASCGENLYLRGSEKTSYAEQARLRYELEPYISDFAAFGMARHQQVLEIGVGLGADHQRFAEAGARLYGIDLTERAVESTRQRLRLFNLHSQVEVGDAEDLVFGEETFDVVYSWGVLHHTPNTCRAVKEVYRVLRKGGIAKVMIYHKWSIVGFMLWMRFAFARLRPFTSLSELYAQYLESPGTKAYSKSEARQLFGDFRSVDIETVLTHGDLLSSRAGQGHEGLLLDLARFIWPRRLIKALFPGNGLFMLITAVK